MTLGGYTALRSTTALDQNISKTNILARSETRTRPDGCSGNTTAFLYDK